MIANGIASFLWFLVILALIPASLWFLKRTPLGGGGGQGQLRSVATLPLSSSQRIVTIEVGSGDDKRWLVLGVTPGSITTLHTMSAQPVEPASAAPAVHPAFAQILGRFRRGGVADDDGH